MAKKQVIKVGDLVRVPRCYSHFVAFGAVCEVTHADYWGSGRTVQVQPPEGAALQLVMNVRLAKQAMKKREAYRDRR